MKTLTVWLLILPFLAVLAGCAIKYDYVGLTAELRYAGTATVGAAGHDERAYVLFGEKGPDFVGLARGGFGNPFLRATLSGRPLADDMSA